MFALGALIFSILALVGVNHDIKLLRSYDRLRGLPDVKYGHLMCRLIPVIEGMWGQIFWSGGHVFICEKYKLSLILQSLF